MSLKRYYISTLHPHIWEHPEGEMVYFEDYVTLWAENARLKAEVERLTYDPMTYLDDEGEWMPRNTHLAAVERLKAEVERLRKANNSLAGVIDQLNAAKEGKQS